MADTHDNQDDTGHNGCNNETALSILLDNAINNDNECSGRSSNLHTASAEEGDKEACNDGGVKTLNRAYAGCDGKGNR